MSVLDFNAGLHALRSRELLPGTNQAPVFGVGIAFSIIGIVVMSLRIFCRIHIISCGLGVDDYLMLIGVICNVGLSIANMVCAWYGVGVREESISLEDYPHLLKSNYATRLLYVFALCFVKLSILVFYLRIDHRKWTRWVIYFLMFTVIGLSIAAACILAFECWPPALFWDVAAKSPDKCMDPVQRQVFYEANGIINIVQDLGIWLVPIPMLWKLQVPRAQKLGVIFLFCIGILALVAGCIRYYYVLKLENEEEMWFYLADSLNWCSIEVYAAIICGSASTFRVLTKTYMPRFWGSRYNTSGIKGHPYNHSSTGDFALTSYGPGRTNQISRDRRQSVHDSADPDSQSEEATSTGGLDSDRNKLVGDAKKGILMSKEFTMKVTNADTSRQGQVAPFSQV